MTLVLLLGIIIGVITMIVINMIPKGAVYLPPAPGKDWHQKDVREPVELSPYCIGLMLDKAGKLRVEIGGETQDKFFWEGITPGKFTRVFPGGDDVFVTEILEEHT